MSDHPMMKCGCAAAGTCEGKPICITHECREVDDAPASLEGRTAMCAYGKHKEVPSEKGLPFFEYLGPGSPKSREMCLCGYHVIAHKGGENYREHFRCKKGGFTPQGPMPHDKYYCGCMGWD